MRHAKRYRVVEQMNDLIKDHKTFGYLEKVEYRAIREPGAEIDYIIRYYPGEGARRSVNRIRSHHPRRKRDTQQGLPLSEADQPMLPKVEATGELDREAELLIARLTAVSPEGFGISRVKARELVKANRKAVEEQIGAFPYRDLGKAKKNVSGWLIAAIEENYTLPASYLEEQEKKRQLAKADNMRAVTEGCQFCDQNGWRRIRTPEHSSGAMKRCTHDPQAESKYENA
jgi:hypothetical protein